MKPTPSLSDVFDNHSIAIPGMKLIQDSTFCTVVEEFAGIPRAVSAEGLQLLAKNLFEGLFGKNITPTYWGGQREGFCIGVYYADYTQNKPNHGRGNGGVIGYSGLLLPGSENADCFGLDATAFKEICPGIEREKTLKYFPKGWMPAVLFHSDYTKGNLSLCDPKLVIGFVREGTPQGHPSSEVFDEFIDADCLRVSLSNCKKNLQFVALAKERLPHHLKENSEWAKKDFWRTNSGDFVAAEQPILRKLRRDWIDFCLSYSIAGAMNPIKNKLSYIGLIRSMKRNNKIPESAGLALTSKQRIEMEIRRLGNEYDDHGGDWQIVLHSDWCWKNLPWLVAHKSTKLSIPVSFLELQKIFLRKRHTSRSIAKSRALHEYLKAREEEVEKVLNGIGVSPRSL